MTKLFDMKVWSLFRSWF